jgi:hypothetical protein
LTASSADVTAITLMTAIWVPFLDTLALKF